MQRFAAFLSIFSGRLWLSIVELYWYDTWLEIDYLAGAIRSINIGCNLQLRIYQIRFQTQYKDNNHEMLGLMINNGIDIITNIIYPNISKCSNRHICNYLLNEFFLGIFVMH